MRPLFILLLASVTSLVAQSYPATEAHPAATVQEKLGYPASARLLIIHADDFGMAHSVNRAITQALENGWVTSASILVPCPWLPEVATWTRSHSQSDLGIHLALNSEWTGFRWGPVSSKDKVPTLLDAQGYLPLLETQVAQQDKPGEVEIELRAQIDRARNLGIPLSHLDTHMGALLGTPDLIEVYRRLGREYRLPIPLKRASHTADITFTPSEGLVDEVVQLSPGVPPDQWLMAYENLLSPLGPGVYELIVHLAYDDDEMRGATSDHPDWGAAWRQHDFDTVRSLEFRQFLKDQRFVLVTWKELSKAIGTKPQ
ncbi:MAG: polysaccharide deacetylase family protein [Acidobacteria bacterium]|nr:polysaccharide deacetylase family protein [Acidobacteriota bacterium]